eukprot:snap_masked-scaffold_6-processed-gene-4.34-mRNA-1 protein AED:1.00 eAED:1.00 QI:0/0/0/0/1/1/2/0/61
MHSIWFYEDGCEGFHFKHNKGVFTGGISLNVHNIERGFFEERKMELLKEKIAGEYYIGKPA